MANIKKNFNFRNGVQVDDDNLLVTPTGLVGIGTTVPTEALDVRGDVTVAGFATITKGNIGFLTVTTLEPTAIIGAGVSIRSGIITNPSMDATGIVTYYGDARYLQGMPTSQWEDIDVGLGYTSIFNTGGNVGIGTNDPRFTLQVGGKVDAGQEGVGISSVGNLKVSGIVTASSFVGDLTGNIVSASTFSGNIDLNADLDVDGHTNLDNVNVAGVTTFASTVNATLFSGASQIGIQSAGTQIGAGITQLNFVGTGNTFAVSGTTIDISIAGGGTGAGGTWSSYTAGIATTKSVGVNTNNLDDNDLVGVGNSFQGLYISNGMIIHDNKLNGNHYIGTSFNGLMAGPVNIEGTLTIDGNYVVV